jgi:hypothetical protein
MGLPHYDIVIVLRPQQKATRPSAEHICVIRVIRGSIFHHEVDEREPKGDEKKYVRISSFSGVLRVFRGHLFFHHQGTKDTKVLRLLWVFLCALRDFVVVLTHKGCEFHARIECWLAVA